MADLSKYTAKEALNLEVGLEWNQASLSVAVESTGHIDVTGYHRIIFFFESDIHNNRFFFTTGATDDIVPGTFNYMNIPGDTAYEIPIPVMLGGVKRRSGDTLYFHLYNDDDTDAHNIYYNLS